MSTDEKIAATIREYDPDLAFRQTGPVLAVVISVALSCIGAFICLLCWVWFFCCLAVANRGSNQYAQYLQDDGISWMVYPSLI